MAKRDSNPGRAKVAKRGGNVSRRPKKNRRNNRILATPSDATFSLVRRELRQRELVERSSRLTHG